jgi:hypothetical protein
MFVLGNAKTNLKLIHFFIAEPRTEHNLNTSLENNLCFTLFCCYLFYYQKIFKQECYTQGILKGELNILYRLLCQSRKTVKEGCSSAV